MGSEGSSADSLYTSGAHTKSKLSVGRSTRQSEGERDRQMGGGVRQEGGREGWGQRGGKAWAVATVCAGEREREVRERERERKEEEAEHVAAVFKQAEPIARGMAPCDRTKRKGRGGRELYTHRSGASLQ